MVRIDQAQLMTAFNAAIRDLAQTPEGLITLSDVGQGLFAPAWRTPTWQALDRFVSKAHHKIPPANAIVGTGPVRLVDRDPARIQLAIANLGTVPIFIGDSNKVTAGPAAAVAASSAPADSSASGSNAAQVATFGGAAGTTAYITGLEITGEGATAAATVVATLTGVQGGTISIPVAVPAGAGVPITPVTLVFGQVGQVPPGVAASAAGVAIALNLPAFGAGNTLEEAAIQGYILTPLVAAGSSADPDGGFPVFAGTAVYLDKVACEIWAIAAVAGQDVRVLDLSG